MTAAAAAEAAGATAPKKYATAGSGN